MQNARLRLQTLPSQADRVLVVAHIAGLRAGNVRFTRAQVDGAFADLRIPAPQNTGAVLSRLGKRGLLVQPTSGHWTLTPMGEALVAESGLVIGAADFQTDYASELASSTHHTIGAEFAPLPLVGPIGTFLKSHPFDRNVFGISRYPKDGDENDLPNSCFSVARSTLSEFALEFHLASDRNVADELWSNMAASMWACRYGVAFIESRVETDVNRNVLIEVGAMLMTGRRCVLLRDSSVGSMPTDLVGHIYKEVDLDDPSTVGSALREWCESDLGIQ